jgi:phage gp36-like protein
MSIYASLSDLTTRFSESEILQLADPTDTGSVDTTITDDALNDADGVINGYLASRYTLPLTKTPTVITRIACDIARYFLYKDRVTDAVKERYDAAIAFLKGISSGQVSLGPDASGATADTAGSVEYQAPCRVFTDDTLADF